MTSSKHHCLLTTLTSYNGDKRFSPHQQDLSNTVETTNLADVVAN